MELDKNKFALAAGATIGVWYVICAALVAIAPDLAIKLFSWIVHLINLRVEVSFPEVIYGFVEVVVLAYITAYVFAWLHNLFMKIS